MINEPKLLKDKPIFHASIERYRGKSGIYIIRNINSRNPRDCYIGQASDLLGRMRFHYSAISKGKCKNRKLQKAVEVYGKQAFEIRVLQICSKMLLTKQESYWLSRRLPNYNTNHISSKTPPSWMRKLTKNLDEAV